MRVLVVEDDPIQGIAAHFSMLSAGSIVVRSGLDVTVWGYFLAAW